MIKIDPNSLAFYNKSSRQKLLNRLKICMMCILLVFNGVGHGSNST